MNGFTGDYIRALLNTKHGVGPTCAKSREPLLSLWVGRVPLYSKGKFTFVKVAPYVIYTACFAAGIYSNMKALMLTNVGAVIAARSCLPVIVCVIEVGIGGREEGRRDTAGRSFPFP